MTMSSGTIRRRSRYRRRSPSLVGGGDAGRSAARRGCRAQPGGTGDPRRSGVPRAPEVLSGRRRPGALGQPPARDPATRDSPGNVDGRGDRRLSQVSTRSSAPPPSAFITSLFLDLLNRSPTAGDLPPNASAPCHRSRPGTALRRPLRRGHNGQADPGRTGGHRRRVPNRRGHLLLRQLHAPHLQASSWRRNARAASARPRPRSSPPRWRPLRAVRTEEGDHRRRAQQRPVLRRTTGALRPGSSRASTRI